MIRKTIVTLAAVAATIAVTSPAQASKRYAPEVRVLHSTATATAPVLGSCGICSESITGYAAGVEVLVDNYNDYPVRVDVDYARDPNQTGGAVILHTYLRVAAHGSKSLILDWQGAAEMSVSLSDHVSGRDLGGLVVQNPA